MIMIALALAGAAPPIATPAPTPATIAPLAPGETETVTRIRYTVGADGKPTGCAIVTSDAPKVVQDRICQVFSERARFKPRVVDGKAVIEEQEKTVRFRVKAAVAGPADTKG